MPSAVIFARRPTTGRTARLNELLLTTWGPRSIADASRVREASKSALAPKKYRVTYCARTSPLPLLPSGPGGIGGITSRRTRHLWILTLEMRQS